MVALGMKPAAVSLFLLSVTIPPSFAQLPANLQRQFNEAERRIVQPHP